MSIPVIKYRRRKMLFDESSPLLYYLKPAPQSHRMYDLRKIAKRIEKVGALSNEDVYHVANALVREMKEILIEGDKVKIDGFGIFYLSINSEGVEKEEDCNVRNIYKVNIRFRADSILRLVNDSTAATRGGENSVKFHIRPEDNETAPSDGSDPGDPEEGTKPGEGGGDPDA